MSTKAEYPISRYGGKVATLKIIAADPHHRSDRTI